IGEYMKLRSLKKIMAYGIGLSLAVASVTQLVNYKAIEINAATDNEFEKEMTKQGFPESYKSKLRQIHSEYPKWVFKAMHTDMTWEEAIKNESIVGRNLVTRESISSWKSIETGSYDWANSTWATFDGSKWMAASEGIIRYYMDPRNFLDSSNVFQFLQQNYDSSTQVASGVETLVKSTFMESRSTGNVSTIETTTTASQVAKGKKGVAVNAPGIQLGLAPKYVKDANIEFKSPAGITMEPTPAAVEDTQPAAQSDNTSSANTSGEEKTYVDMIMSAAVQSNVNPYVLASMLIQEQGVKGTSGLISGTTSPYEGHYNFFNIQAYHSGNQTATQRGLWWASQSGSHLRPWNSREKAIIGGAMYYGEKYVHAGQNTFYLKKFNVQGSDPYKHQYMTYVEAAASEGIKLSRAYTAEMKAVKLEFFIPVYKEMPNEIAKKPEGDGSPNNKLASLSVEGYNISPSFNADTSTYDLIVDSSVSSVKVNAGSMDSKASVSGTGTINLSQANTQVSIEVRAENGTTRKYVINIVKKNGGGNSSNNSNTDSNVLIGPS
ncbi:MAG: peptide-binding protein, partial [Lachnospiraceae bacterium]